jgi:hypothetical protein
MSPLELALVDAAAGVYLAVGMMTVVVAVMLWLDG